MDNDLLERQQSTEVTSIDLCARRDGWVESQSEFIEEGEPAKKVTSAKLNKYNQKLVKNHKDDNKILLKYLQHERLYQMMKANNISQDSPFWKYLDHYACEQSNEIQRLEPLVDNRRRLDRAISSKYDAEFLSNYFNEDLS